MFDTNLKNIIEDTNNSSDINNINVNSSASMEQTATAEGTVDTLPLNTLEPSACTDLIIQKNNVLKEMPQTVCGIRVVPCHEADLLELDIPEEERAVETNEVLDKIDRIWDTPSVSSMANLQGILDNRLYAGICEDTKGVRTFKFRQRYNSGKFSSEYRIKQSDVLMLQMTCPKNIKNDRRAKARIKIIDNAETEYLGKFSGMPEELLDINEILKALYTTVYALPTQADNSEKLEKKRFYADVSEIVHTDILQVDSKYKSYYPLTETNISAIAASMKMDKLQLLRKLRDYGFLYLTPSSNGYQTNVRITYHDGETYTEWRYCLLKLHYFAGIDENSDTENEFDF